jgi:hypothetical protein
MSTIPTASRHDRPTHEVVASALGVLSADNYADWVAVGQSLHDWDSGPEGLRLFESWSATSPKHQVGEPARKWASFQQGGGITVGTLLGMAAARGWRSGSAGGSRDRLRPRRPRARPTIRLIYWCESESGNASAPFPESEPASGSPA